MTRDPEANLILCWWTINAHGFRRGDQVLIDPTMPGMGELLNAQILMPLPAAQQPAAIQRPPHEVE